MLAGSVRRRLRSHSSTVAPSRRSWYPPLLELREGCGRGALTAQSECLLKRGVRSLQIRGWAGGGGVRQS